MTNLLLLFHACYTTCYTIDKHEPPWSPSLFRCLLVASIDQTMGIKDFLKHFPGGNDRSAGLENARLDGNPVHLDAVGLCWFCASHHHHSKGYLAGQYTTRLRSSSRRIFPAQPYTQ
jgi:hypothetical protein